HSERFAAAVVFVGISNQISKRNTTDIPYEDYYVHWGIWNYEDFEKVYDRSPVKYTKDAKTPTLILHGTADPRVHPSQSLELYRSLKMHGKAPVRLVWYPGEGHGNRKNPARLDYSLRTMQWFNYYLKGEGDPDQKPNIEIDYNLNIYDH
ncbi:MAG: prolyl oligopeptidase family serine peptidase, partial [Melioribacteraceae bacterium]|nr:prolyl oligopeptidase family serine peptidase [Melioribacteraceae bacterium]